MIELPKAIAARVPRLAIEPLESALANLVGWTKGLPESSLFYVNDRPLVPARLDLPKSVKATDVATADVLFDTHSALSAQCLMKSWRAAQLAEGLVAALNVWNLSVAAAASRSLVETAAAWGVESNDVRREWIRLKESRVQSVADAARVRGSINKAMGQMAWGTRQSKILKSNAKNQRTNILTLIGKAQNQFDVPTLLDDYEVLCDAVHPSWGAAECFWTEVGVAHNISQYRVLISKNAIGWLASDDDPVKLGSSLSTKILSSSLWAIDRLAVDLRSFGQLCHDVCLTSKVFLLSDMDYWGVVGPTTTYQLCACGSGKKTRFCGHEFGGKDT